MDYNTTGDGQLVGVQLTKICRNRQEIIWWLLSNHLSTKLWLISGLKIVWKDRRWEVPLSVGIVRKHGSGNGEMAASSCQVGRFEPLLRVMAEAPTNEEVRTIYVDTRCPRKKEVDSTKMKVLGVVLCSKVGFIDGPYLLVQCTSYTFCLWEDTPLGTTKIELMSTQSFV